MVAIEFQTTIRDGIIEVPHEYKDRFKEAVRVILLAEEPKPAPQTLIDQLLEEPLKISGFQPLSRKEIYE